MQAKWSLTVLHESPNFQKRKALWEVLSNIAETVIEAWAIMGDFNTILNDMDWVGCSTNPSWRGANDFQQFISDCNLIDVGFQGPAFTWGRGNLLERLDRVLFNLAYYSTCFGTSLTVFCKSDHRALLIKMTPHKRVSKRKRPFCFVATWITLSDFQNFIKRAWKKGINWVERIGGLHQELRNWNKTVFGDIFRKKQKLICNLQSISQKLSRSGLIELEETQLHIWEQYRDALRQEELLWY